MRTVFSHQRGWIAALTGAVAVAAATFAWAAPAQADVTHYSGGEPATTQILQPCGAVWTSSYEFHGTIVTTANGNFREVRQDYYPGTITYQGVTYTANDHQTHTRYLDRNGVPTSTLNGQGLFTVLSGIGVVVFDVGHYVFNDVTDATIWATPKVITFEEPFDFGATICAALDGQ